MMKKQYPFIEENIKRIRAEIEDAAVQAGRNPAEIRLMAVTKTRTPGEVNAAIDCGVALLGENRAQELCARYGDYDRDGVEIHFIGHLQTNKVRQIADKVEMIQSVGSLRLAREIDSQCEKLGREMQVLIEVNIGGEKSKSGVEAGEVESLIREIAAMRRLRLRGLMTIPPIAQSESEAERYFSLMHQLLVDIQGKNIDNVAMDVLSMGMSDDYRAAVKHGATLLRLGGAIFGPRSY